MNKKQKKYNLLLLSPKQKYINYPAHSELSKIFGKKRFMVPLALPTIAALTPDNYNIKIIDEEIEKIPHNFKPDLVGITTLGATINRAYELCDKYKKEGIPVVLGGPYASFMVEEVLQHASSVVIGEAEGVWETCLNDFEKGNLQKKYKAEKTCEYKTIKLPRWDLVSTNKIFQVGVQISRGCPFNCDFCLVSKIFGRKMRYREINNVIAEIKSLPTKYVFFVDDNLTMNKEYILELMKHLKPLRISWGCMASIDVANDDVLLRKMASAGCFNILVGFESLNPSSLDETNKEHNKGGSIYHEAIEKIHAAGMHVNASLIVGFDHDNLDEFDKIYEFAKETHMPNINLHILACPPGTELQKNMIEKGRLYKPNNDLAIGLFPCMHYQNMSQIDIFDKYMETVEKLYDFENLREKANYLFGKGYFSQPGADISFFLKIRVSAIILKEFVFTSDKSKKALFYDLFKLVKQKKTTIDRAAAFLLSMLGYHRHIQEHKRNLNEYRKIVLSYDKGAWKDIVKKNINKENE